MSLSIHDNQKVEHYDAGGTVTSFSFNLDTTGQNSVVVLIFSQSGQDNLINPTVPTSVTIDGNAMTYFDDRSSGFQGSGMYYMLTPPSNATASVVVNMAGNTKFNRWTVHAYCLNGADQSGLGGSQVGTANQGGQNHIDISFTLSSPQSYVFATNNRYAAYSSLSGSATDVDLTGANVNWSPTAAKEATTGTGAYTLSFNYGTNNPNGTAGLGFEIKAAAVAASAALFRMS